MQKTSKYLFLNQMAGPLFRELAEDLSQEMPESSELYTGHPDTLLHIGAVDKLNITSAPTYNRKSYFTRVLSWIKYSILAFFKVVTIEKNTSVFIVSNPPLLGPLVALVCKLRSVPYFVLVYDMHPDTLISFNVLKEKSLVTRLWRQVNKFVWSNAVAVFTIGTVMAERLSTQFDVHKTQLGKVGIIPPWADTNNIKPIAKDENPLTQELNQQDAITVLYSGNMGISHDINSMLEAALILKDNSHIKFIFIGEGQKWQEAFDFVENNNLENVQVLPFQPEERLPFTMALGDISLVALDKGAEGLMVPSKMYYYMAAGSAVIGVCQGRNDLEQSLKQGSSGKVVLPGKPEALANIISELANDSEQLNTLKSNARKSSIEHFSRIECMKKLNSALKHLQ